MIEIEDLTKSFGAANVVERVSLKVPNGAICTVVGTSGSGKTTLLRMINRLVEPSSGRVKINGKDHGGVPPFELRRHIGYVIQGYGLFPHRTVAQNIATVPTLLGWRPARIAQRVDALLALFQLEPSQFRDRMPAELSGGQQQRVGVARALAAEPAILLMDEPFGALDPLIRGRAQEDLLAIQRHLGTTIVLVTHDMEEAFRLGTRIAVMNEGRLLQYATPQEIIARPASDFVADLVGSDRALRLLSLSAIDEHVEPGPAEGPPIASSASLREALAESLWSDREALPVMRDGTLIGRIRRENIVRLAARRR